MKDIENVVSVDLLKKCKSCQKEKPKNEFGKYKNSFDGLQYNCKPCMKIKCHNWYLNNKEKVAKDTLEYQRKNPEKRKGYKLFQRYRIQQIEYNEILKSQNGVCAVCKQFKLHANKTRLSVDHCHKTGKVRGLLCDNCNKALGLLQDDKERISNLLSYISK